MIFILITRIGSIIVMLPLSLIIIRVTIAIPTSILLHIMMMMMATVAIANGIGRIMLIKIIMMMIVRSIGKMSKWLCLSANINIERIWNHLFARTHIIQIIRSPKPFAIIFNWRAKLIVTGRLLHILWVIMRLQLRTVLLSKGLQWQIDG